MAGACTLNWSPVVNNVEQCGGLPEEVCSAAKHIMGNGGGGRGPSIGAAVNFIKFVCSTGKSKNFLISNPGHTVQPAKRARACTNVAAWKSLVACMKGKPRIAGKAHTGVALDRRVEQELNATLLLIDSLDIADKINEASHFIDVEPPDGSVGAKALCHVGGCAHLEHDYEDFKAMLTTEADIEEGEKGLTIKGMAADFGPDREGEAFEPNSLDRAIERFMENPVLAYFHSTDVVETVKGPSRYAQLGQVKALTKTDRGIEFEAFVPRPKHGGFLANVYDQIKSGVMRGVSVGGQFFKHRTPDGWRIYEADLHEVSIAPKPINPRTLIEAVSVAKAGTESLPIERLELAVGVLESAAHG